MVLYRFYRLDPAEGYQIIGVLPERRKNPKRITQESILNWRETILGNGLNTEDTFFSLLYVNSFAPPA